RATNSPVDGLFGELVIEFGGLGTSRSSGERGAGLIAGGQRMASEQRRTRDEPPESEHAATVDERSSRRRAASSPSPVASADSNPQDTVTSAPGASLSRGATLGRYVVLDVVGSGGMGVVYAAYDPELDRKLAVKLMKPEVLLESAGTNGKARLLREAQA